MTESIEELLEEVNEDSEWVSENHDDLKKDYKGKIIAVRDKTVVGASENVEELLTTLHDKHIDPGSVLLETIPPASISFIL